MSSNFDKAVEGAKRRCVERLCKHFADEATANKARIAELEALLRECRIPLINNMESALARLKAQGREREMAECREYLWRTIERIDAALKGGE